MISIPNISSLNVNILSIDCFLNDDNNGENGKPNSIKPELIIDHLNLAKVQPLTI